MTAKKKATDATQPASLEENLPAGVKLAVGLADRPEAMSPQVSATNRATEAIRTQGGRNRNKKVKPGQVFLPNATSVELASIEGFRYEQGSDVDIWSHPEVLLKDPKPGVHYCWPDVEDGTTGTKIASGLYRPILKSELKQMPIVVGATHKGVDDYVHRYRTILCEMSDGAYTHLHRRNAIRAVERLARRQEQFEGEVESMSQGKAVGKFTVSKNGTE